MRFPAYWLFIVDVELEPRKEPAEKSFPQLHESNGESKNKDFRTDSCYLKNRCVSPGQALSI